MQSDGTRKLFQTDAYVKTFDAIVGGVKGQDVALDATAFYAGGGGQPCDLGHLIDNTRRWSVVNVRRDGSSVWHTIEEDPPLIGSALRGELNGIGGMR